MRVVYSRWDMIPLSRLPLAFAGCICESEPDWLPAPEPRSISRRGVATAAEGDCCAWRVPCGRTLDTFDADIIVDASAHQTLLQICRGEGDIVLYRKVSCSRLGCQLLPPRPCNPSHSHPFRLGVRPMRAIHLLSPTRKAGADLSDSDELFVMTDVVRPLAVFRRAPPCLFKVYDTLAPPRGSCRHICRTRLRVVRAQFAETSVMVRVGERMGGWAGK